MSFAKEGIRNHHVYLATAFSHTRGTAFWQGEMSGVIMSQEHGGSRCTTSANSSVVAVWQIIYKCKVFLLRSS